MDPKSRRVGKPALCFVLMVVGCLAVACIPPPPGAHVSIHAEGPLPPLPPPPPFVLPPSVSVTYSARVGCDYVHGFDHDVFYVDRYFYTHHRGRWFCATRPGATWVVVEPAYVPRVLVRGPPPPGWRPPAPVRPPVPVTVFRDSLPFPVPDRARTAARARGGAAASPSAATRSSRGRIGASRSAKPSAPGQVKPPGTSARPYAPGQVKRAQPGAPQPPSVQPNAARPSGRRSPPGRSGTAPGQSGSKPPKRDKPKPGRAPGRR